MRILAAVLALSVGDPALAQSLGECRQIADGQARLACYDRLPAASESFTPMIAPRTPTAAADPALASAENAVRRDLNDPGSARFIGARRKGDAVCGFVNAKNESGGYTGSKLFVHVVSSGETHILDQPDDAAAGAAAREAYAAHCR